MTLVVVILGLLTLVVLHEYGHFLTAKAFGMHAPVFSVGFGPTLLHRRWKGTDYRISAIPLGGYVKISGMTREEELPPEAQGRAYFQRPVYQRVIVTSAGVVVNVIIALLILTVMYMVGVTQSDGPGRQIYGVQAGSPAQAAGLMANDRIVSIGGDADAERQVSKINDAGGAPVPIVIDREGAQRTIVVTPTRTSAAEPFRAGFTSGGTQRRVQYGPVSAVGEAASTSAGIVTGTFTGLGRVFFRGETKDVSSIVGITDTTNQVLQSSFRDFMVLLAAISVLLAVFNVLPILPLDGGHIVLALAEKVRGGKPVPLAFMNGFAFVGLALMLGLFAIGLNNDLSRIFGGS